MGFGGGGSGMPSICTHSTSGVVHAPVVAHHEQLFAAHVSGDFDELHCPLVRSGWPSTAKKLEVSQPTFRSKWYFPPFPIWIDPLQRTHQTAGSSSLNAGHSSEGNPKFSFEKSIDLSIRAVT